jgi:hypothetical protein
MLVRLTPAAEGSSETVSQRTVSSPPGRYPIFTRRHKLIMPRAEVRGIRMRELPKDHPFREEVAKLDALASELEEIAGDVGDYINSSREDGKLDFDAESWAGCVPLTLGKIREQVISERDSLAKAFAL